MSAPWIGEGIFEIDHPRAKPGYKWEGGRGTKQQQTSRPPSVIPEVWKHLTQAARNREIASWKAQAGERARVRKNRGLPVDDCAPDLELPQYRKALEALSKCKDDVVLASVVKGNPDYSPSIFEFFADEAFGSSWSPEFCDPWCASPVQPQRSGTELVSADLCELGPQGDCYKGHNSGECVIRVGIAGSGESKTTPNFDDRKVQKETHVHREKELPRGHASFDMMIMVHEPVPPKELNSFPKHSLLCRRNGISSGTRKRGICRRSGK